MCMHVSVSNISVFYSIHDIYTFIYMVIYYILCILYNIILYVYSNNNIFIYIYIILLCNNVIYMLYILYVYTLYYSSSLPVAAAVIDQYNKLVNKLHMQFRYTFN